MKNMCAPVVRSSLPQQNEVFWVAEMIMKVKEPIEQEYSLIRKDQLVFTYFHFASYPTIGPP